MTTVTKRRLFTITALVGALALAAGCGKSASTTSTGGSTQSEASATAGLVSATPAATGPYTKPITWVTYREVSSLDPKIAFDYPENTIISTLCDTLIRQSATGVVQNGLAAITLPNPTTMVFKIHPGAKFWDGHPVTSADVVYSLEQAASPTDGSFYAQVFNRVKSITADSSSQVTIALKQPDFWLEGELASTPGFIFEKAYAVSKGKAFGTPSGGIMCSGPFKLGKWQVGNELQALANPDYWDTAHKPLASEIDFKGVPSDSAVTTGLETGEITGDYPLAISTLDQLKTQSNLNVYLGPSYSSDALILSSTTGPLANIKVRQALSLAIDRQGLIQTNYHGAGILPRTTANPGTWGYGKSIFQAAWDQLPDPKVNIAKAKQMVQQAGATGQSITLGMSSEIPTNNTEAVAVQSAGEAIGLKVTLHSVSAANYINFFIDPAARKGIDGFFTVNYPDYADPAGLYATYVIPGGSQNYNDYNNPQVTKLMEQARSEPNLDKRAQLVSAAQKIIMQQLPWIPIVDPDTHPRDEQGRDRPAGDVHLHVRPVVRHPDRRC